MIVMHLCVFEGVVQKGWTVIQQLSPHSTVLCYLDGFIGVGDESDEERQHHVDEEGDEGVEVRPTEEPH